MSPPSLLRTLALSAVLGLVVAGPVPAQPAGSPVTLRDTVSVDSTGIVEIHAQNGRITVATWDRAQVGYEVTLTPNAGDSVWVPDSYVDHTPQRLTFGPEETWSIEIDGLLTISPAGATPPTGHYRVIIPRSAAVTIDDHSSSIDVRGLHGSLNIDTHSGSIRATSLHGGVEVETHSGPVTLSFDTLSAPSSIDTHSGPVRLFLPAGAGFELDANLDEDAHLLSDFDVQPLRTVDDEEEKEVHYRGKVNGGGPAIHLDTDEGDLTLRSQ